MQSCCFTFTDCFKILSVCQHHQDHNQMVVKDGGGGQKEIETKTEHTSERRRTCLPARHRRCCLFFSCSLSLVAVPTFSLFIIYNFYFLSSSSSPTILFLLFWRQVYSNPKKVVSEKVKERAPLSRLEVHQQ